MKRRGRFQREKGPKDRSQLGWGAMMGGGYARNALNKFKNPDSTNDIRTYNPFKETLEATGADNF